VYGISSDGFKWIFVTITHGGLVKVSRLFDMACLDMSKILACLRYIFTTAAKISPNFNVTMEKMEKRIDLKDDHHDGYNVENDTDSEDLDDYPIDLDDNDYVHPTFS